MDQVVSDIELIGALHQGISDPLDQQEDDGNRGHLLLVIMSTAAAIATFHNFLISLMRSYMFDLYKEKKDLMVKLAYQVTNMTVNLFLGLYGLYCYMDLPPIENVSIVERINGFKDNAIFGALQVGYNIWALPIGAYFVGEKKEMMIHHVFVIVVGIMSAFSTNGFRYHAPFFFGVIEISSVPLAMWNLTKSNRSLAEKYLPKIFQGPLVFIILFMLTRVILWTPQIYDVLRMSGLLYYTCLDNSCRVSMGIFLLSTIMLTLLQYYWAFMIVKGIFRRMKSSSNKKKQ